MSNAHFLAGLGWEPEKACQAKVKSHFWKKKGERNPLMKFDRKSIDKCYQESGKISFLNSQAVQDGWCSQIFQDELSSD